MRVISTLIIFIFLSFQSFSQSLEGEWRGSYDIEYGLSYPKITRPITLYFVLNKDSSYTIYSYSRGKDIDGSDTIVVCKVAYKLVYKKTRLRSLYLEETQILRPVNAPITCFQKMYLDVRREDKLSILAGTWKSEDDCNNNGKIRFTKVE